MGICRNNTLLPGLNMINISHAFGSVISRIDKLIKERAHTHPGLNPTTHFNKRRHELRSQGHGAGLIGRTEMSILMQTLWAQSVHDQIASPLMLSSSLAT